MRKKFVPPEQTVNGKFYHNILRHMRKIIWSKHSDKWCNNSWALYHDNALAHAVFVVQQFWASKKITYSSDLAP
jgi:hypothetical protein